MVDVDVGANVLVGCAVGVEVGSAVKVGSMVDVEVDTIVLIGSAVSLEVGNAVKVGSMVDVELGTIVLVGSITCVEAGTAVLVGSTIGVAVLAVATVAVGLAGITTWVAVLTAIAVAVGLGGITTGIAVVVTTGMLVGAETTTGLVDWFTLMTNLGEFAPDSRDARLIAVQSGAVIPKLKVPSPVIKEVTSRVTQVPPETVEEEANVLPNAGAFLEFKAISLQALLATDRTIRPLLELPFA